MTRLAVRESGFAVLETALAMPLLLGLLFGLVQFTYIYRGAMQLDLACFRAARSAIVRQEESDWLRQAKQAGKNAFSYYPNAKALSIEAAPGITIKRIGAALTLQASLDYPLRLPLAAETFGALTFPLRTQCTLTSESGEYAE